MNKYEQKSMDTYKHMKNIFLCHNYRITESNGKQATIKRFARDADGRIRRMQVQNPTCTWWTQGLFDKFKQFAIFVFIWVILHFEQLNLKLVERQYQELVIKRITVVFQVIFMATF